MQRSVRFTSPRKRRDAKKDEQLTLSMKKHNELGWSDSIDLTKSKPGAGFKGTTEMRTRVPSNGVHIGKGINVGGYELRDKRKHQRFNAPSTPQTVLADKLIDILINAKKDIERVRSCESIEGARKYAEQNDLYFYDGKEEPVDINGDGVPEIVLVNRRGEPVVVNGHRLKPSKFPFKLQYNQLSDEERAKYYGYNDWVECGAYGAADEFDDNGNRHVEYDAKNLPGNWAALKKAGYRPPAAPRKALTARQMLTSELNTCFNVFYNSVPELEKYKWMKSIMPRMKIVTMAYMNIIDRWLLETMDATQKQRILDMGGGDVMKTYDLYCDFKREMGKDLNKYLKENMDDIIKMIQDNFGSTYMAIFNEMKVPDIIAGAPTNDDVEYDQSDRDAMSLVRSHKAQLKRELNVAADQCKEGLIVNIIEPLFA